ncbi:hypothetical protein FRC19_009572 [Serendipita sp. 401]|nr:hypothetical protein FRC19_009572 [Serendipita sp. 401]
MSDLGPSKRPKASSKSLHRICSSAMDLMSLLGDTSSPSTSGSVSSSPSPQPTSPSEPGLVLKDVKRPSDKLSKFKLAASEVKAVLRVYRQRLDLIRTQTQEEYRKLCDVFSADLHKEMVSALSDYWIRTRDELLSQTVELAAETAKMVYPKETPAPKAFNKASLFVRAWTISHLPPAIRSTVRKFLASLSDMEYRQISTWFQNRRARTKAKTRNGKPVPPPPTLEQTSQKLRDLMAQEDAKCTDVASVIVQQKVVIIEDDEEIEQSDHLDGMYSPQAVRFILASIVYPLNFEQDGSDIFNLDECHSPPGSFPAPFEMPDYELPSFPAPRWPRPPQFVYDGFVQVAKTEMDDLVGMFDNLQVVRTKPVLVSKVMKATNAARFNLAKKVLKSIRSFVPAPKLKKALRFADVPQDEGNPEHTKSFGDPHVKPKKLKKKNKKVTQVQINESSPVDVQVTEPSSIDVIMEMPSICHQVADIDLEDSFQNPSAVKTHPIQSFGGLFIPMSPRETPDDLLRLRRNPDGTRALHPAARYEPQLEVPIVEDVCLGNDAVDTALKMTLEQLGYSGEILEPEPPVHVHIPLLAASQPIDPILDALEPTYSALDPEEKELLNKVSTIKLDRPPYFDPFSSSEVSQPAATVPSIVDQSSVTSSVDTNGVHTSSLYDPQCTPLPIALLSPDRYPTDGYIFDSAFVKPTLRHYDPQGSMLPVTLADLNENPHVFDYPMPKSTYVWEPAIPTTLFTPEGEPLPEHDPNLKWESIINYLEECIQKEENRETRWANQQEWPISSTDPRSMLQYLNL